MHLKKYAFSLLLTLSLTACAPPTPPGTVLSAGKKPEASTEKTVQAAKKLTSWTLIGAVAAKSKQKSWTASINWHQEGMNRYQLRLFGPLGGGSILVEKKGRMITYQDGHKRVTTTNIDQLFYKETGVRVPLHNLYYWVRGVKAPGGVQSSTKDAQGRLISLTQGGYTVMYSGYQTIQGRDLPTKLRVTGPGGSLKLVIKQWKIH